MDTNESSPLAAAAPGLLARHAAREEQRLAESEARANLQVTGPLLRATERLLAEARVASMFDDATPCISRYDAFTQMKSARDSLPTDHGVRLACAHVQHLWHEDRSGHLTIGQVAQLRDRYARSNPRSRVASVIDDAVRSAGFASLPVADLAKVAAEVRGADEAELLSSFQAACIAHGLTDDSPHHQRARAFIAGLVNLAYDEPTEVDPMPLHQRVHSRLAQVELEVPHEEVTEEVAEAVSPNSGLPLVVELGAAEGPEAKVEPEPAVALPEHVAGLQVFGQVDAFAVEPAEGSTSTLIMDDPTAPGEQLEVSLSPHTDEVGPGLEGADVSLQGMEDTGPSIPLTAGNRGYAVRSVRAGRLIDEPVERVQARGMPAVLAHIAARLREVEGDAGGRYQVRAEPANFNRSAFVVLDPEQADYLWVTAESEASGEEVLSPEMPDGTEHLVHQEGLDIGPEDAGEVMTAKAKSARQVSWELAARGITAETVEARVLDGGEVRVGGVSMTLTEDGLGVVVRRGARERPFSLAEFDEAVGAFLAFAASEPARRLAFTVRPYFTVDCVRCGSRDEYTMPDRPADVSCGACGNITPMRAVALQLEVGGDSFPGYLVTADVPGDGEDQAANAKRMLATLKSEGIRAESAALRDGRLELSLRQAGEPEVNRIRRVFTDIYGANEVTATRAVEDARLNHGAEVTAQVRKHPVETMPTPANPGVRPVLPQHQLESSEGTPNQSDLLEEGTKTAGGVPRPERASRAGLPVAAGMRHVLVGYEDGGRLWVPVEAATDAAARQIVASYMDGSEVLDVVDSRTAQLDLGLSEGPPLSEGPMPMLSPPGFIPGPDAPGAAEDIERAQLDPKVEADIHAAMMHYRNTGVGIATATKQFLSEYRKFVEKYGEDTAPGRHQLEAALIRISKEVYEKPAFLITSADEKQDSDALRDEIAAVLKWSRSETDSFSLPTLRELVRGTGNTGLVDKINNQIARQEGGRGGPRHRRGQKVLEPGVSKRETSSEDPNKLFGKDSTEGHPGPEPKVKSKTKTRAKPLSWESAPTEPKALSPKPPRADGRTQQTGWGQSYSDTSTAPDTSGRENATTTKWDAVSSGAGKASRGK